MRAENTRLLRSLTPRPNECDIGQPEHEAVERILTI